MFDRHISLCIQRAKSVSFQRHKNNNLHGSLLSQKNGFTLIELAMVLIVIGVLISLGASLVGPLTKRSKYIETKDMLSGDVGALISFASYQKRLPTAAEFPTSVRAPNDSWTKALLYVPDSSLTSITAPSTETICNRKMTGLTVCQDAACTVATNITNVAFVIGSGADNYNIQTGTLTGGVCPAGQTCVRAYPLDTPNIDDYASDFIRTEAYDDIVSWVTLDELRTKTGCVGSPLALLNNELPFGFRCSQYSSSITASGGVPFGAVNKYKWCTQGTIPGGLTLNPNIVSADCSALAEASWGQADQLSLSASANVLYQTGTYSLTFFARDNADPAAGNDNIAQKALTLTVNVTGSPIRIWFVDTTGSGTYDFTLGSSCMNSIADNGEISNAVTNIFLVPGTSCIRHSGTVGNCNPATQTPGISYDTALAVDTDCDYQVNFTLTSGVNGVQNR